MDKEELQQKIAFFYSKLPPKAQGVFSSMSWLETLKTISKKYGLNETQTETLGTETTLVLLGIIHPVEYEEALTKELGLGDNTVEKILIEIEESILKTVRPELLMAFESNKNGEVEEEPEIIEKLDTRFEKLPKEVENVIKETKYQAILYSIAKEYNLTVAQMGILEKSVTNLIAGSIHPDKFEDSLGSGLKMPLEITRKIVNDINERIFKKIREGLMKNSGNISTPSRERATPQEGNKIETSILNKADIKVVESSLPTRTMDMRTLKPTENREDILKKIEKPEFTHEILTQKLSTTVQIPTVKTEHTLENITKTPPPTSYPPKADPYRLSPDE